MEAGPVSEELFIELSSEPNILSKYIDCENNGSGIQSKIAFKDDEFSDNDLEMIDCIIGRFGHQPVKELTTYTQRINAPWYKTAKGNLVLELLVNGTINNTEYVIDMGQIVSYDDRKYNIYKEYVASH